MAELTIVHSVVDECAVRLGTDKKYGVEECKSIRVKDEKYKVEGQRVASISRVQELAVMEESDGISAV